MQQNIRRAREKQPHSLALSEDTPVVMGTTERPPVRPSDLEVGHHDEHRIGGDEAATLHLHRAQRQEERRVRLEIDGFRRQSSTVSLPRTAYSLPYGAPTSGSRDTVDFPTRAVLRVDSRLVSSDYLVRNIWCNEQRVKPSPIALHQHNRVLLILLLDNHVASFLNQVRLPERRRLHVIPIHTAGGRKL